MKLYGEGWICFFVLPLGEVRNVFRKLTPSVSRLWWWWLTAIAYCTYCLWKWEGPKDWNIMKERGSKYEPANEPATRVTCNNCTVIPVGVQDADGVLQGTQNVKAPGLYSTVRYVIYFCCCTGKKCRGFPHLSPWFYRCQHSTLKTLYVFLHALSFFRA